MEEDTCWNLIMYLFYISVFLIIFKLYNNITKGRFNSKKRLDGQVIIVTGASRGMGKCTATEFAKRGAKVILADVGPKELGEAKNEIVAISGNENIVAKHLDLASFKSVRKFAKNILETENRLDVLVNNAGVNCLVNPKTEDGIPMGLQVNHYGHFLLTNLLIGLLKRSAPSRIIHISSIAHLFGQIDFDNLTGEKITKWNFLHYCNSKLYNFVGSNELSRRLEGTGVTSNSVYPGAVRTELIVENINSIFAFVANTFVGTFFKSAEQGAQTAIYLAVSDNVSNVSGKYFADCKKSMLTSPVAKDKEIGKRFFERCCDIVGLEFEERLI
ncbi:retinol dehydrogenase 11-like [Belonocnema kinseyi]|uniref:retinol dehydrogenase 11-like n=1 Tax=Belonocnema kinseyi TaxID=2817044 RepID=UPI00143CC60E|nr:retinol dehydrogenase 11-like [Belonocnema kinseyi]